MFGLPVLLAVLALAGAPASTPVTCNPAVAGAFGPSQTVYGLTFWQGGQAQRVELGVQACQALLYAAATPRERIALARLNPLIDWPSVQGVGLLTALHESTHVALESRDECLVERTAFAKLPQLLGQYVPKASLTQATNAAIALDARQRAGGGCA